MQSPFDTAIRFATDALWAPVELVTRADSRLFAPLLGTTLAIGLWLAWRRRSGEPLRALLSPRVWLHRSSLMDLRLVALNAGLRPLIVAPLLVSAYAVVVATTELATATLGPAQPVALAPWLVVAIYTVVLFVVWDLSRYLLHRLMHAVPALWAFHAVHHSAEVLTPLTVHRVHPVESLLYGLRGALVTGGLAGAFFYGFGPAAVQWEIWAVNGIGLLFNAAGANLRHSHVWLSYGRLERWLISPAQHQLHHARDAAGQRANYGAFLALWDRLGGTLRLADRPVEVGLDDADLNHRPDRALSALVSPAVSLLPRGRRAPAMTTPRTS